MKTEGMDRGSSIESEHITPEKAIKEDFDNIGKEIDELRSLHTRLQELQAELPGAQGPSFSFFKRRSERSPETIKNEIEETLSQIDSIEADLEVRQNRVGQMGEDLDKTKRYLFTGKQDGEMPLQ